MVILCKARHELVNKFYFLICASESEMQLDRTIQMAQLTGIFGLPGEYSIRIILEVITLTILARCRIVKLN